MLTFRILALLAALAALPGGAVAQGAAPPEETQAMLGTWEISNADRDKLCTVTFAREAAPGGMKLAFAPECAPAFPITEQVEGWKLDKDGLHLLDARGRAVLDLDEVERGIFEGMRPGEGRYFVQSLAAVRTEARPEQIVGEWQVSRGTDETICVISFSDRPAGDRFALELKPGCGAPVSGFAPTGWQLDRGELVISSARGVWRFEEAGEIAWRRVPEGTEPLWLVRQADVRPAEGG